MTLVKRPKGTPRAELYNRILSADPPLCASGDAVAVLNSCERRRQLRECICRFDANEIADDAAALGCDTIASAFDVALDAEDVEGVTADFEVCLGRRVATSEPERDALDRLERVLARLALVIDAEAALTDEYSDAIDP